MVKLRFISDTHFTKGLNDNSEHETKEIVHTPFGHYFKKKLEKETDAITFLAGDIADSTIQTTRFLEGFFSHQHVFFTGGNHELYNSEGKTIYEIKDELRQAFPKSHMFWHYLENDWMWVPGTDKSIAVIGSEFYTDYEYSTLTLEQYNKRQEALNTLYTAYTHKEKEFIPFTELTKEMIIRENMECAAESLNDFRWGNETPTRKITPQLYLELHHKAREEVIRCHTEILKHNPDCKIILMTHHGLSTKCIDEAYLGHRSNASYTSDLEDWVSENLTNVRLVHSGHVHCGKDFKFGKNKTRYLINACGYIHRNEPFRKKKKFNPNLIIDSTEI